MSGIERIVLIGFSGSGKTSVARMLGARLGWDAIDTDTEIERAKGMSVPEIFREEGEAAFRAAERTALVHALARNHVIVATGGGAPVDATAWAEDALGRAGTLVVALDAEPDRLLYRLQEQARDGGDGVERPLLAGGDPLARIVSLKNDRQAAYDAAHLTLSVDTVSIEEVTEELVVIAGAMHGKPLVIRLDATSGSSDIQIGPGLLSSLGVRVRERWPRAARTWVITDLHVAACHGEAAELALRDAGFVVETRAVSPGESSKSLRGVGELYDWLLNGGIERGDVVVALGGGVVGDLAGFVAATVLRGVGLVQAPTSLLAAVDSSVGGKTGVNHSTGKNLIGAFLQPQLVLADTRLLRTLPPRELRSGWAEVVKHAIIQRSTPGGERGDLASFLMRNRQMLKALEDPALAFCIWRNVLLKSVVVAADERESGIRAFLNFGHTIGHAIEASSYELLHGEAVALGMRAAAELGVMMGTCGRQRADDIHALLDAFELPAAAMFEEDRILALLRSDKKRVEGRQRYVLPAESGGVLMRDDVPHDAVRAALASVNAGVLTP